MRVSKTYGREINRTNSVIDEVSYRIRCCIPAIVQSYDTEANTIEAQPAIREKVINSDGTFQYVQLPILVNVPVVFPQNDTCSLSFDLKQNDEVLILFSDLSFDNFWEKGNVQNPIETRRHDLSDGIAIPCNISLPKNSTSRKTEIKMSENDISFKCDFGTVLLSEIIAKVRE